MTRLAPKRDSLFPYKASTTGLWAAASCSTAAASAMTLPDPGHARIAR